MDSTTVIGVDLGTTNTAVAFANLEGEEKAADFPIAQLVAPGNVEPRPTLPSFLYLPSQHELPAGSLSLPWDESAAFAIGTFARDDGSKVPDRLISSAKSWLCQEEADRRGPILPWKAPGDVSRQSPVEASANYLSHIASAWQSETSTAFAAQEIILTVPASFDAVARELTVEAARLAGIKDLLLLEEPQAAFYAWLEAAGDGWRQQVGLGERILVCDIGGGTTDLTLIVVSEQDGDLQLERIAVGDHILLGGDNMDLSLAVMVQNRLKEAGTRLDSWQLRVLTHECRKAKEKLLSGAAETATLTVAGRGSRLIGGAIGAELTAADVEETLVDGFFPHCLPGDATLQRRRMGLSELGLPYEADPAITRHLARFLRLHRPKGEELFQPTAVLFNGGVLKSPVLQARVAEVLNSWLADEGSPPVKLLAGTDLELAVARGAARYGLVRRGTGIRIRGGTSRSYYIGVEVAMPAVPGMAPPVKAVCVAPFGMEEGTEESLPGQEFGLVVGEPVEFPFLASTTRAQDRVGDSFEDWEDEGIEPLTAVSASLEAERGEPGTLVPVTLHARVTEIGTLELWCHERDGEGRWKLEFQVRESPQGVA
ncbi:MAG: Hsp70 family protein [Armatimonadetes bacterium]|nr:Hsp70 family protein [Armatimonadota bacterium]